MKLRQGFSAWILLLALLLNACGGGGTPNTPPVALAGQSQNVITGTTVTLDGSGSSDANGDPLTYAWTLTSKPTTSQASLSNAQAVKPSFVADIGGTYVITLVVNDGKDSSAASTVTVSANTAPIARAGHPQVVLPGTTVQLDGSLSSDAEGDPLTFAWSISAQPTTSTATLSSTSGAKPTFVPKVAGSYVIGLIVNDGKASSLPTSVTIIANTPPVAHAVATPSVLTGATVTLDGTSSMDADEDALTYAWTLTTRPAGSSATLSSSNVSRPTFTADVGGTYVVTLVVGDGVSNSAATSVTVAANTAPVANAGPSQQVSVGDGVTLDGSASADAERDALTYQWTLSTRPAGSSAVLAGATSVRPTFTADRGGRYEATLTVNDGRLSSAPATVSIVANTPPVAQAGMARQVVVGTVVTLDGSHSSDADNDPLTYAWTLTSKPNGSAATLTGAGTLRPTFTADLAGSYAVSLVVNDGKKSSAASSVTITAVPSFNLTVTAQYQKPAPLTTPSFHLFTEAATPVAAVIPYVWIELQQANGSYVTGAFADVNGQAQFKNLDSSLTYVPVIKSKAWGPGNFDLWVVNNTNPQDRSATTVRKRYLPYSLMGSNFAPGKGITDQSVTVTAQLGWDSAKGMLDDARRDSGPFSVLALLMAAQTAYSSASTTQAPLAPLTALWSTINAGGSSDGLDHFDQGIASSATSFFTPTHKPINMDGNGASGTLVSDPFLWIMGSQNLAFRDFSAMTISHEFTHFIHAQWIRHYSPNGSHGVGDYQDPALAFHEGMANGMAMVIHMSPIRLTPYLREGKLYVYGEDYSDTYWINPRGWFHEMSVSNFIWELGKSSGSFGWSLKDILAPVLSTTWSQGAWVPNVWAYGKILKDLYPSMASALNTLGETFNITLMGNDVWGSAETKLGNRSAADSLPLHTTVPIGGSGTQICSVGSLNEYNKLGNRRYFWLAGDGKSHTVTVTGPSGTSPVIYLSGLHSGSQPGANVYTTDPVILPTQGVWGYVGDCSVIGATKAGTCLPMGQTFSSEQCWTVQVSP